MKERIVACLIRQKRALEVLAKLQEEEFSQLMGLNPTAVTAVEFSIQELIRQIVAERTQLRELLRALEPGASRVNDVLPHFEESVRAGVSGILAEIDVLEQSRAVQAEKNSCLALALFEQSKGYVDFIQEKAAPKPETYTRRGEMGAYARTSRAHGHTLGRT